MSARESAVDRKDHILEAAAALFGEKGYYKTTTADVARAVGVTQPYVFHFFKSKEELYLAVLDRAGNRLVEAFSGVQAPAEELARVMGEAFLALLATHRSEILLVMTAHSVPEEAIRAYMKRRMGEMLELLTGKFERAGVDEPKNEAIEFIGIGLRIAMSELLDMPEIMPC